MNRALNVPRKAVHAAAGYLERYPGGRKGMENLKLYVIDPASSAASNMYRLGGNALSYTGKGLSRAGHYIGKPGKLTGASDALLAVSGAMALSYGISRRRPMSIIGGVLATSGPGLQAVGDFTHDAPPEPILTNLTTGGWLMMAAENITYGLTSEEPPVQKLADLTVGMVELALAGALFAVSTARMRRRETEELSKLASALFAPLNLNFGGQEEKNKGGAGAEQPK